MPALRKSAEPKATVKTGGQEVPVVRVCRPDEDMAEQLQRAAVHHPYPAVFLRHSGADFHRVGLGKAQVPAMR